MYDLLFALRQRPARQYAIHRIGIVALMFALVGCGSVLDYAPGFMNPYRPDVQQGNIITAEMVDNLSIGSTREQVKFLLGTPLVTSVFHADRWDYVYYLKRRDGETNTRRLTVFFNSGNKVEAISNDLMPPEAMADNLIMGRGGKPIAPTVRAAPPIGEPTTQQTPRPTAPIPGTPTNPTTGPSTP